MNYIYTDEYINKLKASFKSRTPNWLTASNNALFFKMKSKVKFHKTNNCLLINFGKHQAKHIKKRVEKVTCVAICENDEEKQVIRYVYNKNNELFDEVFTVNEFIEWINDMKFDKIIMNPPYSGSTHLKILKNAIQKLNKNGKCVNLSPVRWLQDPLAQDKEDSDFKKYEETIVKFINDCEIIPKEIANKLFNINYGDLLLSVSSSNKHEEYSEQVKKCMESKNGTVILKIKNKALENNIMSHSTHEGPNQKFIGNFGIINSHLGNMTTFVSLNEEIWTKPRQKNTTKLIYFDSKNEIKNFFNSLLTDIMRFYAINVKINNRQPWQLIPWLGNEKNPRTGLKGYLSDWTDDDFRTYFNITDDEWQVIETTMENYK